MRTKRSRYRTLGVLAVAGLAITAVSCDDDDNGVTEPDTGSVAGTVVDDADEGVSGVTVTLTRGTDTRNATSGADGAFTFNDLEVGSWQADLTPPAGFAKDPAVTYPVAVTVTANQTATVTLPLVAEAQGGTISGTVAAGGSGVQGATLTLTLPGGGTEDATSDADGAYAFEDLEAGDYTVEVTPPTGFELATGESGTRDVTLEEGGEETADFELQAAAAGAGSISGTVANGPNGVEGIVVDLTGAATAQATTDADGAYTFEGLADGDYTVTLDLTEDEDHAAADDGGDTQDVTVTDEGAATADFDLVRVVRLVDFAFEDAEVTINTGSTVRWVNTTNTFHTITPDDHSEWARVETDVPEVALEVTFDEAGTFDYFCEPHQSQGMVGTITVN